MTDQPYDSRQETYEHILRVRELVRGAIIDLDRRAASHDQSKMQEPELAAFDKATPDLKRLDYGTEGYDQALRDLGPALEHHYANNDHHPEHFPNGVSGMSLMALIEMLCDWKAASERTAGPQDFNRSLVRNQERFGYSDEIDSILRATAKELGLL